MAGQKYVICPYCGKKNHTNSQFCSYCGTDLSGAPIVEGSSSTDRLLPVLAGMTLVLAVVFVFLLVMFLGGKGDSPASSGGTDSGAVTDVQEPASDSTSEPASELTQESTPEPLPEPTSEPTPEPTSEPTPEPTPEQIGRAPV